MTMVPFIVIPAKAGIPARAAGVSAAWIPAFAGMTEASVGC
ncbi:MAG: hypothetical protein QOI38_736 [Sphingomonadales bacterium]|jgi:hypothetical protein|nr:hypothetical protein [Sphingomonadales bacterium]